MRTEPQYLSLPLWKYLYVDCFSSLLDRGPDCSKDGAQEFSISTQKELEKCCEVFGPSFYSWERMAISGKSDPKPPPRLVGTVKISFVVSLSFSLPSFLVSLFLFSSLPPSSF